MEHGHVRESNSVVGLFEKPEHPYTQSLLGSIIHLDSPPMDELLGYQGDSGAAGEPLLSVKNVVTREQFLSVESSKKKNIFLKTKALEKVNGMAIQSFSSPYWIMTILVILVTTLHQSKAAKTLSSPY